MFVKMSLNSKREYIGKMRERYLACKSKKDKTFIIDEIVSIMGYDRKYVIQLLNSVPKHKSKTKRHRSCLYLESLPIIHMIWEALDYPCAERLHPVLVSTAELLDLHGECNLTPLLREQIQKISCSTLRRRLMNNSFESPKVTITRSKHSARLRKEIPIERYDWDEKRPGALEIDLVEHNGGSSSGHYAYTLSVVDIVTGYSRRRALLGRSQAAVFCELQLILKEWPMTPWGLHSDNGSEFINNHLVRFCKNNQLKFTRSRPYRKNDNAHVEQKNRQFVREIVGYSRFETSEQVTWLNEVYACLDLHANLFLPMRKIIEKSREGSKVRKRYDVAKPPIQRLYETGGLDGVTWKKQQDLLQSLNPLALHRQLEKILQQKVD
jgi:transposase InsO family protein